MKKIIILILGIIPLCGYSQEFLHNSDYIYGEGATDSAAIYSLSVSIGINVINEVNYRVSEVDKKINESFSKNISLNSSYFIRESKPYYLNGVYYRYINKKEFINDCLSKYSEYKSQAEKYDTSEVKHKINLVLGYYYKAYMAINSPIFNALTGDEYKEMKNAIMLKAKDTYISGDYGSLFISCKDTFGGYWLVTNICSKSMKSCPCLYGFEYKVDNGWESPSYYKNSYKRIESISSYPNDNAFYTECLIPYPNAKIIYRITYEDEYGKIDVDNNWYFMYFKAIS